MRHALALIATIAAAGAAHAQAPTPPDALAHAGTLTCTLKSTASQLATEAQLSCGFQGPKGRRANLEGTVAREERGDIPAGKYVMVWTVLASTPELDLNALAGKYVGRTGANQAAELVNEASSIVLQPETSNSALGTEWAITVLTLRVAPVRARLL